MQERLHDTCHDVLSSHSLSFLAPCKQSYYAWYRSLPLSQLPPYSFHIQLLYVSQSREPILSHLASLPDSVEITYPHMQNHSNMLLLTPVLASPAVVHIYQSPIVAQLATGLNQKSEGVIFDLNLIGHIQLFSTVFREGAQRAHDGWMHVRKHTVH